MKTLGQAAMTTAQKEMRSPGQGYIQAVEKIHLLSIGSIDRSYALHDALLEEQNLHPSAALEFQEMWLIPDYRELWVIPRQEAVHLAVVHDTLSHFQLDEACRFVRRQWPSARILVIHAGEDFLDDALYDDRVVPGASSEFLRVAIQRLLERRRE